MTPWYADWAIHYSQSFGLSEKDAKAVFSWETALVSLGATAEILARVTPRVLAEVRPAPNYPREHLDAIVALVVQEVGRGKARAAFESAAAESPECDRCRHGWVQVPHLSCVDLVEHRLKPLRTAATGHKIYATTVVACDCRAGLRRQTARDHADRPVMTLAEYDRLNPYWKPQLAEMAAGDAPLDAARRGLEATPADVRRAAFPTLGVD